MPFRCNIIRYINIYTVFKEGEIVLLLTKSLTVL
jgi:hypothetical protein